MCSHTIYSISRASSFGFWGSLYNSTNEKAPHRYIVLDCPRHLSRWQSRSADRGSEDKMIGSDACVLVTTCGKGFTDKYRVTCWWPPVEHMDSFVKCVQQLVQFVSHVVGEFVQLALQFQTFMQRFVRIVECVSPAVQFAWCVIDCHRLFGICSICQRA